MAKKDAVVEEVKANEEAKPTVETRLVELPIHPASGHVKQHIQVHLTLAQGLVLKQIARGLESKGAMVGGRYGGVRVVNNEADALRWLLDQVDQSEAA